MKHKPNSKGRAINTNKHVTPGSETLQNDLSDFVEPVDDDPSFLTKTFKETVTETASEPSLDHPAKDARHSSEDGPADKGNAAVDRTAKRVDTVEDGPASGVDSSMKNYSDIFGDMYSESTSYQDDLAELRRSIEEKDGRVSFPEPDVFNAYPPEVQRKIMEWVDRDVKTRREDESRRQDEMVRATISRERTKTVVPVAIIIISIFCAALTGIVTGNPVFAIAFLVVPIAVIIAVLVMSRHAGEKGNGHSRSPYIGKQS